MNLQELNELIKAIPKDDHEMINFYQKQRQDLIADIKQEIGKILNEQE